MFLLLQANATALYGARDLLLIAPELILTVCACVALVMEVILPYRQSKVTGYFALVGIALALASLFTLFYTMSGTFAPWRVVGPIPALTGFYGMVRMDGFAFAFKVIFLVAAALAIA